MNNVYDWKGTLGSVTDLVRETTTLVKEMTVAVSELRKAAMAATEAFKAMEYAETKRGYLYELQIKDR